MAAAWKLPSSHALVIGLLGDKEPATIRAALDALHRIGGPEDVPAVLAIYDNPPDEIVRRAAAATLTRLVSAADWLAVFTRFAGDAPPRHRVTACTLAARYGGPDQLAQLQRLAEDADGHVRKAARAAIAAIAQ